ncbi:MAG: GNAT family N-acetyltransferase [Gemmatimonadetes bacterium]|nr:GNAT family N-acetyltransferase [Gemmatimonadota bacterium]
MSRVQRANENDIAGIVALNNKYAPQGLTLKRTEEFGYAHLADFRVIRDADGAIVGCAALDEYSPSVAEVVSLAVSQDEQGLGHGKALIKSLEQLARKRGYAELFSVSFSDELFLDAGFEHTPLTTYPEKIARYGKIASELKVGEKHCFMKRLA